MHFEWFGQVGHLAKVQDLAVHKKLAVSRHFVIFSECFTVHLDQEAFPGECFTVLLDQRSFSALTVGSSHSACFWLKSFSMLLAQVIQHEGLSRLASLARFCQL